MPAALLAARDEDAVGVVPDQLGPGRGSTSLVIPGRAGEVYLPKRSSFNRLRSRSFVVFPAGGFKGVKVGMVLMKMQGGISSCRLILPLKGYNVVRSGRKW